MDELDNRNDVGSPSPRPSSPAEAPPVPLQTYLWEDVRRERRRGGYPWTHFVKKPFDPNAPQEILQYDRSPGSKRKYGSLDVQELDESPSVTRKRRAQSASAGDSNRPNGDAKTRSKSVSIEEQIVASSSTSQMQEGSPKSQKEQSPGTQTSQKEQKQSKEQTPDSPKGQKEQDPGSVKSQTQQGLSKSQIQDPESSKSQKDQAPGSSKCQKEQPPGSPKSILKHQKPDDIDLSHTNGVQSEKDSPKDTECCHPFVDKLKIIADKAILKSPRAMKKHLMKTGKKSDDEESMQEIITLEDSPLRRRREMENLEKLEKLGKATELTREGSKKFKDHIYESIEDLPKKTLKQTDSEKELTALSKSLSGLDQEFKDDQDDLIARDSLTRSLDQYLKEELMGTEDKEIIDSKNEILQDILRRIADESDDKQGSSAPLSKMDSEEDDTQKVAKKMPMLKEDSTESTSSAKPVDKCLVIDITETVEEEIVDFVVMKNEDQDLGDLPEPDEIIDLDDERSGVHSGDAKLGVSAEGKSAGSSDAKSEVSSRDDKSAGSSGDAKSGVSSGDAKSGVSGDSKRDDVGVKKIDDVGEKKDEKKTKDKLEAAKSDGQGRWSTLSDHEYESIGDPDSETAQKPQTQEVDGSKRRASDASSTTSAERRQLQVASSSEMEQSHHEEQVESDREMTVQEMQQQLEDKYFNKPPAEETTAPPMIQVESPEVETAVEHETGEHLPMTAGQRGREMQKRIKAQAGKLKTKFKGMKKPSFTMPERKKPKIADDTETGEPSTKSKTPKFSMPEFKMPDRPKMPDFKMPERAKMTMPKFKMPDRPKMPDFKMPDRPKMPDFKMPDRPKMPDFKMPSLKRHSSLKEPTHSSESTADSKKKIAFDFRTYPRIFSKKSRDEEYVTSSPKQERAVPVESATVPRAAARKKGPVGARWVNRFSDIKFADDGLTDAKRGDFEDRLHRLDEDYRQMQQEQEDDEDLEIDVSIDRPIKEGESFDRGGDSMGSEEYSGQPNRYWADEDEIDQSESRDFNYGVRVEGEGTPLSTQEERGSSGESFERHRRGVLEEIDADEFFLRQKGISQDDIEVGKYLSSEIRDAFKTPVNALEQLGAYNGYDERDLDLNDYSASRDIGEDDIDMDISLTPLKPERTRSLRKQRLEERADFDKIEDLGRSSEVINGYNTFPPNRPRRQKKKKAKQQEVPDDERFNDENDRNLINRDDLNEFDRLLYENEMMQGKTQPDILVIRPELPEEQSRQLYENEGRQFSVTNAYENEKNFKNLMADREPPPAPPRAPKRRKRSLRDVSASSEPGSMINAQFHDDWPSLTQLPPDMDDEVIVHRVQHEYVIPLAESEKFPSPTPPRRTRSRSQISRATTAPDEDRTSHGAESIQSDLNQPITRNVLDMRDGSGYAVVKRTPSVPKRRKRASKSSESYRTTPRMKEPPPRPPARRLSEPDLRDSPDVTQYEELDDEDDLQSKDVVMKMKDRPLPAPPRPPRSAKRKRRKDSEYPMVDLTNLDDEIQEAEKVDDTRLRFSEDQRYLDDTGTKFADDIEDQLMQRAMVRDIAARMIDDVIQDAETQVKNRVETEETEMWTQTDPMPDDFVCEDVEIGPDAKVIEPTVIKDYLGESKTLPDSAMSTLDRNLDKKRDRRSREDSEKLLGSSESSRLDPLDVERARRIADAESLSRGLRRFRESSRQRTFSSSRTPSERAVSEKALLLERTLVTPTKTDEVLTQATLVVQPVPDDLDIADLLEDKDLEGESKHLEEIEDRGHRLDETCRDIEDRGHRLDETCRDVEDRGHRLDETCRDIEDRGHRLDETCRDIEDRGHRLDETCKDFEETSKPQEEPPIPKKRRGSLKKSRPIPAIPDETPIETPQTPSSPEVVTRIIERRVEVPIAPTPDTEVEILKTNRLQVSNLDVENLNVSQLQANSIKVSEIDGVALQVKELNSKSGNLVVSGIEIAPGVLQDILDKITPSSVHPSAQISTQTDEPTEAPTEEPVPERPPPPQVPSPESLYSQPYQGLYYPYPASIPPASFYTLRPRDYSEDDIQQVQTLPRSTRRRHTHKRDSTSEEEQNLQESTTVSRHRRPGTKSPEPSVREISGQLARACCNSVQRTVKQAWSAIQARSNTEERKKEIQIALIILLVFVAGLILIALSDNKAVHHHHWEFFNPPSDKNA